MLDGLCLHLLSEISEGVPQYRNLLAQYGAYYDPVRRTVVVLTSFERPSSLLGPIVHEVCHAYQHRVASDAGFPGVDWVKTEQGLDFIATTGWRREGDQWIAGPQEPWWGESPNPLEDGAQVCANWYLPTAPWREGDPDWSYGAPVRRGWAEQWLPPPP